MNCICRLFNWVCSIGRIFRFCKSKKFMPLTNCNTVNTTDKPTSIVTWNIQGLFIHMNKTKTKNILNQLLLMKQTDIFCLQEVFEDHLKEEHYLYDERNSSLLFIGKYTQTICYR